MARSAKVVLVTDVITALWPAGGLPTSTNLSGSPLDNAGFRFAHPLQEFPGTVFKGNGECSPHSTYDYLSVRIVLVPTLEREAPAIRVRALPSRNKETAPAGSLAGRVCLDRRSHSWSSSQCVCTGLGVEVCCCSARA